MRVLPWVLCLLGQQSTYVKIRSKVCNDFNAEVSISRVVQFHAQKLLLSRNASQHAAIRRHNHPRHPHCYIVQLRKLSAECSLEMAGQSEDNQSETFMRVIRAILVTQSNML